MKGLSKGPVIRRILIHNIFGFMAERQVSATRKDGAGDILALCGGTGVGWSPRQKHEAISDIESGAHTYFVSWNDGKRTDIHVVNGSTGKYLRTDWDSSSRNNLDDLPDC